jgi:hypothetical protein
MQSPLGPPTNPSNKLNNGESWMTRFARLAALVALALTPSFAPTAAFSSDIHRGGLIPPFEVFTVLRSLNLEPAGSPMLRGAVYIVRAVDDDDQLVRVTLDARSGRVLTVTDVVQGDDYSTPGRMGALPMPPGQVPAPPPEYRPDARPMVGARPGPNYAARPAPDYAPAPPTTAAVPPPAKKPAVAARPPTPRARPADTASTTPAATGVIRESTKPGKSIPAPVARTAATPSSSSGSAAPEAAPAAPTTETPAAAPKAETPMVPVAPLE